LAQPLNSYYQIWQSSDGACFADETSSGCDPGDSCNPPPPIKVPCPPEGIEPDDEPSPPPPG
jgi:hypothetical protein